MRKGLIIILGLVLAVALVNATPVSDTYSYLEKLTEYDTKTPNAIETNHFWDMARQIESFGQDALLVIGEGLKSPRVNIRIAAARISYKLGRKSDAITALLNVIGDDKEPAAAAIAGEVLGNLFRDDPSAPDKKATADKIREMLETSVSPYQRLALLRLLFRTGGDTRVVKEIKDMVAQGSSEMRLAAALTLAEMERFEDSLEILKPLSSDPTETGRLAALFVRYYELLKAYERKETAGRPKTEFDYRLLDEIMAIIKERYVDTTKIDDKGMKNLLNAAAHGIAGALDKFSGYQDEKEKQKSQESLNMRYGGIGAYVSMRDEFLTIERPIYGGPAYKAGLRSLDRITEVEGETTQNKDINELTDKLKGKPDTPVKIKVFRRGWTKEREFTLTRAIIAIKTARAQMLDGQIGFLSITSFGDTTSRECADGLAELTKKGMKALVIDLRRNPGGLLRAVVEICDLFLDKDMTIVTTRDRTQTVEEYRTERPDKIDVPIYIMVDEGTASASEILSGVLQDYKKAVIIGKNTYGKGSVQHIFELGTTNKQTALRLTVAKYYLPSGRSIHRTNGVGGVEPDIKALETERDLGKEFEFNKLIDSGELDKYLDTHYMANHDLFLKLADDDGLDYKRYPDYDNFYGKLKARLDKDEVRESVREHLRRRVADERGSEFLVDVQQDAVLQRSIIEAVKSAGLDPANIPLYKPFANKFKEKEAATPK